MIILAALVLAQATPSVPNEVREAQQAMAHCLHAAALRYATSPEPAETIVTAAFGLCSGEQAQLHRAYAREVGEQNADELIQSARSVSRESMVSMILDARMKKAPPQP